MPGGLGAERSRARERSGPRKGRKLAEAYSTANSPKWLRQCERESGSEPTKQLSLNFKLGREQGETKMASPERVTKRKRDNKIFISALQFREVRGEEYGESGGGALFF